MISQRRLSFRYPAGNPMKKAQIKRKRGVCLSASGIRRLRQAIHDAEVAENGGRRLTTEALSNRAGVSVSTVSRLWSSQSGVDQRTLRLIFSAFKLELEDGDVQGLEDAGSPGPVAAVSRSGYPSGPVPLDSPFYVLRPPIESLAFAEIDQPGCVIRIKAPAGFGKSSLLLRILQQARCRGGITATIDFQQADLDVLTDASACLQWLCMALSIKLGLAPRLTDYWNELAGPALSATLYLREYILKQADRPVVLAINELNRILAYPAAASAVLPLLRSWHEEAKHDAVWQHLRLVVVYSTDVYLPLDINQSPFNIGLPLTLPEFTLEQVQALADRHHLAWEGEQAACLMALLGGNPTLVRVALYHLSRGDLSLDVLLQTAGSRQGIFRNHLQRLLSRLQASPLLFEPLRALATAQAAMPLESILAYQLEELGLIKPASRGWQLSCELYRVYLQQYFARQDRDRCA